MTDGAKVVEIGGVSKQFGQTTALEGIDLEIGEREFVSLIGPSGCGKSTLLRFISGLDKPRSGSIELSPGANEAEPNARTKLAFVFQDAQLLPWRSVLDNVALPLELQGSSRSQALSLF